MSTYFVTGATGSTGRRPVAEHLRRRACGRVFALVRPQSAEEPARHGEPTPPVPGDRGRRQASPHRATDHASERTVREQGMPWRPGAVVGGPSAGEVDGACHLTAGATRLVLRATR